MPNGAQPIDALSFADDNLVVGTVLRFWADFTKPPKTKRFIIAGIDDDAEKAALVLINTDPPSLKSTAPYQIQLDVEGREAYIEHECYIDCSRFYYYDVDYLRVMIASDPEVVMGCVEPDDSDEIKRLLTASVLLKPRDKALFHFDAR